MPDKAPSCLCGKGMTFLAESKRVTVWHCQGCDRVLVQRKNPSWQHWYKPEK